MIVVDHLQIAALLELSSLHSFAGVHFRPYVHEIPVIVCLRANGVLLIDLEVSCCTYSEPVHTLQLFYALQESMQGIEQIHYWKIHFLNYNSLWGVKFVPK